MLILTALAMSIMDKSEWFIKTSIIKINVRRNVLFSSCFWNIDKKKQNKLGRQENIMVASNDVPQMKLEILSIANYV